MYESPIELLFTDIHHQIVEQQDEQIYQAVMHFVPNVNREELLRALKYDRGQYDKGYADGKRDAMAELVRCKDCKHKTVTSDGMVCECALPTKTMKDYYIYGSTILARVKPDAFCSYGERREGE